MGPGFTPPQKEFVKKLRNVVRRKWANAHLKKTIQHFAHLFKLIRKIPFFETRFSQNRVIKKKKKFMEPYSGVLRSL